MRANSLRMLMSHSESDSSRCLLFPSGGGLNILAAETFPSRALMTLVDKSVMRGQSLTRCLSDWLALQAKCVDARKIHLGFLSCFLASLNERSQDFDVARKCCRVVGKLDPHPKATTMDHPFFEFIRSAGRVSKNPRLPLPHFCLILSILGNCGAMCRLVVVQLNVKSLIHGDIALTFELAEAGYH